LDAGGGRGRAQHLLCACVLFLLAGCATPLTKALLDSGRADLPARVELTRTPFYSQTDHQCGPASLAMALEAAGSPASPDDLSSQVYLPGRKGSLAVELLVAARRHHMLAIELPKSLHDLLAEVAHGTPVVVLQNNGLDWLPVWHYAVVIGYDLDTGDIVLRSGHQRRLVLPLTTFEHTWARARYWAMLVLPPGQLPATISETSYLAAAAALEKSGSRDVAEVAYRSALQRWPDSLTALMGLGNTLYANGNLAGATDAFRRATEHHPDSAPAFNNLAQVLADQGHLQVALVAARRAVELGGPYSAIARETLEAIQSKSMAH
jgi:Peptidase_C39 like family/Tetratricopeptide repeat